ncbi:hypothetical protein JDV02_009670 [Purpureocillium takamizusanense]|uniref:F-box domain-containing protein n=1 Tax=Purpureocillium takamizusanense TaxID=2060973 RepID=A0A9Q8QPA8_9HYPO|nr:uncharacterized protein JDV02_009670 [Purpureocillium takamizusanense]UNI23878.1 hypothetical protein JDV02_009670 [Purpureocillium takamizusanense]
MTSTVTTEALLHRDRYDMLVRDGGGGKARVTNEMPTIGDEMNGGEDGDEARRRRPVAEVVQETVSGHTAMRRVFETSELLELILVRVDMQTLLVSAQRASRTWHALIETSPALQRRLFFLPEQRRRRRRRQQRERDTSSADTDTDAATELEPNQRWEREQERVDNPLLKAHFAPFFADPIDPLQLVPAAGDVTLEEALWELDEEIAVPSARAVFRELPLHRLHGEGGGDSAYRRVGASWKRMLTSQPPVTRVGFLRRLGTRNEPEMQIFEPPLPGRRDTGGGCSSSCSSCSSSSAESARGVDASSPPPSSAAATASSPSLSASSSSACGTQGHNKHRCEHHQHKHDLRMGHLYHEVLTRIRWASTAHFQVLAHAQALPRDEFVRRATMPRPWNAVWGDNEEVSGLATAATAATAANDGSGTSTGRAVAGRAALREMHDAGAEVVVVSYRGTSSCCYLGALDLGIQFWGECVAGSR